MIKVKSKINIKSTEQEIWSFLNNISLGLSFNRFHKKIHIQNSFSINIEKEMIVEHNFGFGTYDMVLKVVIGCNDMAYNNSPMYLPMVKALVEAIEYKIISLSANGIILHGAAA